MAIALVGQAANTVAAATSITVTRTTTAGNCLVAVISVATGSSQPITGVTDTAGNTWSFVAAGFQSGSNTRCEIWVCPNAASVTSVTASKATAQNIGMNVSEWSGVKTASPVDVSATLGNASSTTALGASVTTTDAGDVVISGISWGTSPTASLTAGGFTAMTTVTSNQRLSPAYRIPAATGTYQPTWTMSAAAVTGSATVALLSTSAAPAPPELVMPARPWDSSW